MAKQAGPSESALSAAWHARRCAMCGGGVVAVLLADDTETCLCATHFRARLAAQAQVSR